MSFIAPNLHSVTILGLNNPKTCQVRLISLRSCKQTYLSLIPVSKIPFYVAVKHYLGSVEAVNIVGIHNKTSIHTQAK